MNIFNSLRTPDGKDERGILTSLRSCQNQAIMSLELRLKQLTAIIQAEIEQRFLQSDLECQRNPNPCHTTAYKVLHLDPSKAVKKAYKLLIRQWHPDKSGICGPELLAAENTNINNACRILMKR